MRDSILIGVVSGTSGGIIFQLFVWIFYLMGISKTTPILLGAYVSVRPGLDYSAISAQALGSANHLALSAIVGVICVLGLNRFGVDLAWLKGLAYGVIFYLLVYNAAAKVLIPIQILQPDLGTSAVYLFGNLVYGLFTTIIAAHFLKIRSYR